jgi:hypothetical protein
MTNRIFQTLKSRLPDGARAESKDAVDAIAEAVAGFKNGAAKIAAVPSRFVLELILARSPARRGYPIMRRVQLPDRMAFR